MVLNEESILAGFDKDQHNEVARALKSLKAVGFFQAAIEDNKKGVLADFSSNAESLTKQIMEIQETNRLLLTLEGLADSIQERKI